MLSACLWARPLVETQVLPLLVKCNVQYMPKFFVFLILSAVLAVAGLAVFNASMSQYLTALIALAALTVSVVSAFKEDLFPFRPRVLLDEVLFAPATGPTHDSPVIVLPIAFVNEGHGSGVIEGLTLKIEGSATAKIYTPVVEIDYPKFLSGKRALHGENLLGTFNSFQLGSQETIKKYLVFTQEGKSSRYPFSAWAPDKYQFRLFIKHTGIKAPVELATVAHQISATVLAEYKAGVGVSFCPSRELAV